MSKTKTWILLLLLQMFTLTTYAQSTVAEKRVTLNMTQVTMKQLFAEVRKQTGLNFLYKIGGQIYDGAVYRLADDGYFWNRIRGKQYLDNVWTPTDHSGIYPQLRGCDRQSIS